MKISKTLSNVKEGYKLASYNSEGKICSMLTGQEYVPGPVPLPPDIATPLSHFFVGLEKDVPFKFKDWKYYSETYLGYTSVISLEELNRLINVLACDPENVVVIKISFEDEPFVFTYSSFFHFQGVVGKVIKSVEFFRELTAEEKSNALKNISCV